MDTIRKGEILCIETGKYSDRIIVGHFRALRDIPYSEWNEARATHSSPYGVSAYGLTGALVQREMLEDAGEVREIHADDVLEESEV